MESLEEAIKEFKELLNERSIYLKGKITIDLDKPDTTETVYQTSNDLFTISKHSETNLHEESQLISELKHKQYVNHNSNYEGRNSLKANTGQNYVLSGDFPIIKASCNSRSALPPFENIMQSRNATVNEESSVNLYKKEDVTKVEVKRMDRTKANNNVVNVSSDAIFIFDKDKSSAISKFLRFMPKLEPIHSSLLELLKSENGISDLSDVIKKSVKEYLTLLTKEELVDVFVHVLGLEDEVSVSTNATEHAQTDEDSVVSNTEDHENNSRPTKSKVRKTCGENRRKTRKTKGLKVIISKEESEPSAKTLKKRQCLSTDSSADTVGSVKIQKNKKDYSKVGDQSRNDEKKSNVKVFVCKMCNETFPSRSIYRKHLKTHAYSYKCDVCDKVFKSKDSLYHHQRGLHAKVKPYHCNVCDSSFSFHHSYKLHLQRHKGERPFPCSLCPKTYLTSSHLKEHMRAVHLDSTIVCHICGKKFSYNSALKLHLQSHSDDKTYNCSVCNKEFNSKRGLNRHEVLHMQNKRFKCNVCGKYFKSENYRSVHSKLHSNTFDKQFTCDICGKSFFYKCILESHVQTHSKFRSFACTICDKTFKSKASLYSHKYVHNEGQAYSCTVCSKSFKTKNCLSAHMKRHQNQNTFVCSICGKTFPDKGGLSKHTKTVHLPHKYYSCKICDRTGTRADNMRTHVKSHRNHVGPLDDLMNFILCVEEPNSSIRSMQPSDDMNKKIKGKKSSLKNNMSDSDKLTLSSKPNNPTNTDPLFHESAPLLLSAIQASSEIMNQKETCTPVSTNDVGKALNDTYRYRFLPSDREENIYNINSNSCYYPPEISKSSSSTTAPSIMSSVGLQLHSSSDSTFNQFIPNYYGNYIPVENVNYSSSAPSKTVDGTHIDWLTPSSSQTATKGDPIQ